MVATVTFGSFAGELNGNSIRIAEDVRSAGSGAAASYPAPANAYVIAKILTSMATTIPSIVIVLLLGRFYGGVHLAAWQWIVITVIIWLVSRSSPRSR